MRLTHLPTGIVVAVPERALAAQERSHGDEDAARAPLRAEKRSRSEKPRPSAAGEKKAIEFGSQIRSYVLAPYRMVKDHRTELKVGNVDAVLDGDLDQFIEPAVIRGSTAPAEG